MELKQLDHIKINFIIGTGRSGTTLLVVLLNNLANCISTPEIHHFIYFYKKYKEIQKVTPQLISDYKQYLAAFFKFKKNPLIGPMNSSLLDSLQIGQEINYSQITKLTYLSLYGEKGTTNEINLIVDKNPYYTLHIDKIISVFPNARFLALIRDYRAYALSNLQSQKPNVTKKSPFYYGNVWNLFLRKITDGKRKYNNSVKIVRYEDLVINKEQSIKEIMEFFDLPYSESVFDFHIGMKEKIKEIKMPAQYERMVKKINDLSSPINSDRVSAWEKSLLTADIEKLDFISGKIGAAYGYAIKNTPTPMSRFKYFMSQLPDYLRVKLFEILNSPKIYFYLRYKDKMTSQ